MDHPRAIHLIPLALILSSLIISFSYYSNRRSCVFKDIQVDDEAEETISTSEESTSVASLLTDSKADYDLGTILPEPKNTPIVKGFSCEKNCEKFGNCNREFGRCECPYGRDGDACEIDLLPACRLAKDGPAFCGPASLKSCECLRQCFHYICNLTQPHGVQLCDSLVRLDNERMCFERSTQSFDRKRVNDPPSINESGVKYYKGFLNLKEEISEPLDALSIGTRTTFPPDDCPNRCHNRGACLKDANDPDSPPFCACLRGYEGQSCEQIVHGTCPNDCHGRGECFDGWCHCKSKFWGIGCERDTVYQMSNDTSPNPADFKIYVYDLPSSIAHQEAYEAGWREHDPLYIAYKHFLSQLLNSQFITQNPQKAHLFYIPALTYAYTSNLGDPNPHLLRVISYVQNNYPWWNRTSGKDHILWTSEDRGACWLKHLELFPPIKLTHFGYYDTSQGGEYKMGIAGISHQQYACYHPLRDVVVPPYIPAAKEWTLLTYSAIDKNKKGRIWEKKTLLFFAGSIRVDEDEYSGGARQEVAKWYKVWNASDVDFNEGFVGNYYKSMHDSLFCFAPYGHGFGVRVSLAVMAGCIPVVIQDNVVQPLEEFIPYEEFSIRLNNNDIHHLPYLLRSLEEEQIVALQHGLVRYWRAFVFDPEVEGTAFEHTIRALRRRYLNLKAGYYGRHQPYLF